MKKALCILYGIDDKYSLVKRTITLCKNYFDRIILINTGGEFTFNKLNKIHCDKLEIYNQSFLWGDTDSPRRYVINMCDFNDWIFWLDSDECPTKFLLDELDNVIHEAETKNLYNIRFPAISHRFNNFDGTDTHIHGNVYYSKTQQNKEVFLSNNHHITTAFIMNRLIRKNKNFYVYGNLGGHSQFAQFNDGWLYKNLPINHYKSEKTEKISVVLHTWVSQCPNFPKYNDIKYLYASDEYKMHERFKIENTVKTTVDLVNRLKDDESFKSVIRNTYCTDIFKNSKFHYSHYIDWIEKYDMDIVNDDGNFTCNLNCCRY